MASGDTAFGSYYAHEPGGSPTWLFQVLELACFSHAPPAQHGVDMVHGAPYNLHRPPIIDSPLLFLTPFPCLLSPRSDPTARHQAGLSSKHGVTPGAVVKGVKGGKQ